MGLAVAPFSPVASKEELFEALDVIGVPSVLKTRRLGYDGKGQVRLESVDDGPKPFTWRLSPRMIRMFVLGSERADGIDREIPQKWFGDRSFVELTRSRYRGVIV